ncbi:MAG: SMC family ATPase [Acidimicrobiia bacterium]|nr:SMC family ATPase [Acidimicrobiia bacterium]
MRPLELTLRGFQSYGTEHRFDFRDRRLLGIVGPIGSGKSSLLDGIAFALYGKTPRAGRGTKDLINQRGSSAHVELWFEVDGEVWRAVRALRRKGQSAHNLYRHATSDPESERLEEVTGERAMTARVEGLLGLDFDAFNRSVFLAQNRFAEFLQATAAQRDAVLKGVFNFERLGQMEVVAKTRRDELRAELADLERLRSDVERDRDTLQETKPLLETAADRLKTLDGAREVVAGLETQLAEAEREVERAKKTGAGLADVAAQLPARKQSAELLDRARSGGELLDKAQHVVSEARTDLDAARRHLETVRRDTGGVELINQATALVERRRSAEERITALSAQQQKTAERRAGAESDHTAATARLEAAVAAEAAARSKLAAAEEAVEAADQALHAARDDSMARSLRAGLVAGEACPVCDQTVATPPAGRPVAAIDKAEKHAAQAVADRQSAQSIHTRAAADVAGAEADVAARAQAEGDAREAEAATVAEVEEATAALAELEAGLAQLVPADDPVAELESRRVVLAEAEALLEKAQAADQAARAAFEEVRTRHGQVSSELVQLATTVATLAAQLGGDLRPQADAAELTGALEKLRALWEDATAETTRLLEGAEAARAESQRRLDELGETLGLADGETLADARQRAAAEHGKLAERVESIQARITRFEELEAGSAKTVGQLEIYTTLADDLLPSRFLKFILDEERRALAELGSEHFERMTRGRYRFSADGQFDVADLAAAEAHRRAESLSGGETFLASLALALALAEMVARTGGRLDAFFLDEGFGSLDPEHLDLAMEGIEALVGGNRLVAVVSHVPELRERVEDLIELSTDNLTGDTVVVRP